MGGCVNELKRQLGPLRRLIEAAALRYEELGEVRGNVRVPNFTEAERVALAGLIGDYVKTRPGETLVLPLRRLEELLQERGLGESLPQAAAALTGRQPITRAERRAAAARRWEALLTASRPAAPGRALDWHGRVVGGASSAQALLQREFNMAERALEQESSNAGHEQLQRALSAVLAALDHLPADQERSVRLPVFASQIAGDPHTFDADTLAGRLLLRALADLLGESCGVPHPAEDAIERGILLTAAGLLPDGISSAVACFGLRAARRADGTADAQVAAAWSERSILTTTLRQVGQWRALEVGGPILHAVENPPVYEELVDAALEAGVQQPIVCTSGFLSVAAYRLLDLAVAGGAAVAYGGDFDPNGLTIAAKLLERYGDRIRLWGMDVADYLAASNHPDARPFDGAARQRLQGFRATPLEPLAQAMLDRNLSAYQEAVLDRLKKGLLG